MQHIHQEYNFFSSQNALGNLKKLVPLRVIPNLLAYIETPGTLVYFYTLIYLFRAQRMMLGLKKILLLSLCLTLEYQIRMSNNIYNTELDLVPLHNTQMKALAV